MRTAIEVARHVSMSHELQQQAAVIRASGVLGKPGPLLRLFDFLLERSLSAQPPREIEIAIQVFGKAPSFDVSQDSLVRVYVHKLRRRLDEFHARGDPGPRLLIPKGQYRLSIEPSVPLASSTPVPASTMPSAAIPRPWHRATLACSLLAAALAGATCMWLWLPQTHDAALRELRSSSLWAPLFADELPITLVLGDYYLLGETDESSQVQRLVREFFINSGGDLLHQLEVNPQRMQRYRDLNLTYLPTASAFALQDLVPLLAEKEDVRIVMMSDLSGSMLTNSHIVYVGYISGLGMLGDAVFAGSRLSPGGSYDELVDATTRSTYVSSAGTSNGNERYTDYGYLASFPGPNHNRIVVIAGTRDLGVMHTAAAVTQTASLQQMNHQGARAAAFESLFEIHGLAKASLDARLLFVAGLDTTHVWDAE